MTDVRAYLHYFQTISLEHVGIFDFFVMDINEPLAALRDRIMYPALIMNSLSGSITSPNHDNVLDETKGGFLIISRLSKVDDFSGEMILLQQMKQIGMDIISRMNYDLMKCEPRAQKAILGFNLNSVSYEMIDGIFDNCFGFIFTYRFSSAANISYDPNKWRTEAKLTSDFVY